jgi:hypothetical protein
MYVFHKSHFFLSKVSDVSFIILIGDGDEFFNRHSHKINESQDVIVRCLKCLPDVGRFRFKDVQYMVKEFKAVSSGMRSGWVIHGEVQMLQFQRSQINSISNVQRAKRLQGSMVLEDLMGTNKFKISKIQGACKQIMPSIK